MASVAVSLLYVLVGALPLACAVADAALNLQKEPLFRVAMWPYVTVGLVIIVAGVALFMEKRWARWPFLLVASTLSVWMCYVLFVNVAPYVALAQSNAKIFPGWPRVFEIVLRGISPLVAICLVAWLATAFVFRLGVKRAGAA
jgi:hypothetical protein